MCIGGGADLKSVMGGARLFELVPLHGHHHPASLKLLASVEQVIGDDEGGAGHACEPVWVVIVEVPLCGVGTHADYLIGGEPVMPLLQRHELRAAQLSAFRKFRLRASERLEVIEVR